MKGESPRAHPSTSNLWRRYVEWEKTIPERFDPDKSKPGSDYNLHHSIVEATAEEIDQLLGPPSSDEPPKDI